MGSRYSAISFLVDNYNFLKAILEIFLSSIGMRSESVSSPNLITCSLKRKVLGIEHIVLYIFLMQFDYVKC